MSAASNTAEPDLPSKTARRLMRTARFATLATADGDGHGVGRGWPFASLVAVASDAAGAPLMLLSDLALHSRNLAADTRAALLFDGTADYEDPLAGPRFTVQGRVSRCEDAAARERYTRGQPGAEPLFGFRDFHLYRLEPLQGHLVAGFGRIDAVAGTALLVETPLTCAAETELLNWLNSGGRASLLARDGSEWIATGIDAEGFDLVAGTRRRRLDFPHRVVDAEQCRLAIATMSGS